MKNITFKQYLASKKQLLDAIGNVPVSTHEHQVVHYCSLTLGECEEEKIVVNLKPKHKVIVEWRYDNIKQPSIQSIVLEGVDGTMKSKQRFGQVKNYKSGLSATQGENKMLKLIKNANQWNIETSSNTSNFNANIKNVASFLKEDVQIVYEGITHVLDDIMTSVQSGKPVNVNLAYGRHDTLAAFIAGVDLLASQPKISNSVRQFFAAVSIRNGQMTHLDAVATISQIGLEKNFPKRQTLSKAIDQYNSTGDKQAAKTILDAVNRVSLVVNRAMQPQAPTEPSL